MLHITICDDERSQIEYLSTLVRRWANEHGQAVKISAYESAESFLFTYEDDKTADILLLDIQMKELDGVALARKIRKSNDAIQIIFITGYPDYIAEGYDVSALHYLIKPVKESKLFDVLSKAVKNNVKQCKTIYLSVENENILIPVDEILFIEAFDHFLKLTTIKDTFTVKIPLYELLKQLTPNFVRCHRCYIVNLERIKKISRSEVTLDGGKIIPLSRRLYTEVNRAMMKYITGGEQ